MIWHDNAVPVKVPAMRLLLLLIPVTLLLAACASLSEDECRGGNWYDIGVRDGADGRPSDFIFTHAKACADYGVRPDRTAWLRGREEGLRLYCTPERAFQEGRRGRSLAPVCPIEDLAALERANDRGQRLHFIEEEIEDVEREIREITSQIAALPADDPTRASLISQRGWLRMELLRLRAQRARYL